MQPMPEEAGPVDHRMLINTPKVLKATTTWLMTHGSLSRFSLVSNIFINCKSKFLPVLDMQASRTKSRKVAVRRASAVLGDLSRRKIFSSVIVI